MGYDMYWVNQDLENEAAVKEAATAWEKAVAARDALTDSYNNEHFDAAQKAAEEAYDRLCRVRLHYFRANIHGMGRLRTAMDTLGMMFDDVPHPNWPSFEEFGITDDIHAYANHPGEYPDQYATLTEEQKQAAAKYQERVNEILSWHGRTDTPGIPAHKFSSNDGWLVLPAECEAAVRRWQQVCEAKGEEEALAAVAKGLGYTDGADWWKSWIAFLDGASRHGGFEVY